MAAKVRREKLPFQGEGTGSKLVGWTAGGASRREDGGGSGDQGFTASKTFSQMSRKAQMELDEEPVLDGGQGWEVRKKAVGNDGSEQGKMELVKPNGRRERGCKGDGVGGCTP
jgi:hypothetical protein